jgi:hypothetical protein
MLISLGPALLLNLRMLGGGLGLLGQLRLMIVEPVVRDRDVAVVPASPVLALVATDKQDRLSLLVEREQRSDLGTASGTWS